jgi:hypothetical protein
MLQDPESRLPYAWEHISQHSHLEERVNVGVEMVYLEAHERNKEINSIGSTPNNSTFILCVTKLAT